MTKVTASGLSVLDTTFWLKSISFGSNFFYLAKVLATTNSEPGKALSYISTNGILSINWLIFWRRV